METKKPIQSKSLWFNVLTIVAMVGASLLADDNFRDLVGSNAMFLIIVVNVINMWIRFNTVSPISTKPTTEVSDKTGSDAINKLDEAIKKEDEERGMY